MRKVIPTLDEDFCDRVPAVFNMTDATEITKEEFSLMFDVQKNVARMSATIQPPSSAKKKQRLDNKNKENAEDYWKILKYFGE